MSTSKNNDNDCVEISICSEEFLLQLFGQPMLNIHGKQSSKLWRKILAKIAKVIEKSVNNNVKSDGFHVSRLHRYIGLFKASCESKNTNHPEIILSLTGIILELLGSVPNYRERKRINRKNDYFLDGLRSVHYIQSPYQKMRTILEASRYIPFHDFHKHDDLFEIYISRFNGNPEGFIQWYKSKYPEVYLKLF